MFLLLKDRKKMFNKFYFIKALFFLLVYYYNRKDNKTTTYSLTTNWIYLVIPSMLKVILFFYKYFN